MNVYRSAGRVLVLLAFALPSFAQDSTPPVITPNVAGTLGDNGWFVTDVSLTWTVTDDESAILSTSGCDPFVLTQDDTKRTLTCIATSSGGTSSVSYVIGRDATPPQIGYLGSTTWEVDQQVSITCSVSDVTSGVASETCTDITGHATTFDVGPNTVSSTATDFAGNSGTGSVTFTIVVTAEGMSRLVDQLVAEARVARNLKKKLQNGNTSSFIRSVEKERDKSINPTDADTLIRLAAYL